MPPSDFTTLPPVEPIPPTPGIATPNWAGDPGARQRELRRLRVAEKTKEQLDRMVPVEAVAVTERPTWEPGDTDAEPDVGELVDFTGQVHRIRARCVRCDAELVLDSIEAPTDTARIVAAGGLRGRFGTFSCDACIEAAIAEEDAAETAAKRRERLEHSKLPGDMQGLYFNEMIPGGGRKEVVEEVREWGAVEWPEPRFIYLWSQSKGAGKSRLAATVAWARLQHHHVRYASVAVLMAQLGAAFSDDGRRAAVQVLTGKGALILDDLDKTNASEWAATQIFAALDGRIQARSPILITGNLPPARLGEKFKGEVGEAIMSRVSGMKVLELPGRDMRLQLQGFRDTQAAEKEAAEHALQEPEENE